MNLIPRILIISVIALVRCQTSAAPFQNLGFEDGNTSSLAPYDFGIYPGAGVGSTPSLLPGWTLTLGNTPVTSMGLNLVNPFDESSRATLLDSAYFEQPPMEGRYTLRLIRSTLDHYTLSQQGDVPADARYLTFTSRNLPFVASINGIDLANLNSRYFLDGNFIADISSFAGQTVDLSVRTVSPAIPTAGFHDIDAISMSVPEPSAVALGLVGTLFLGAVAFHHRRRG